MTELIDKTRLHDALRKMGQKQVKLPYRNEWTPERPTTGYCYVVAEVVYHYLAPKGSRPYFVKAGDEETHWFIKGPDGEIYDLTADQFDTAPDYTKARRQNFRTPEISRRGRLLADLLGLR